MNSNDVRSALRRHARPEKAEGMRRYLRSALPCLGVPVPAARAVTAELFRARPFTSLSALNGQARALWDGARFREERYVVLDLLRLKPHRALLTARAVPLFEHLIRTGAWWDLVDVVSSHVVAAALENDPVAMTRVLKRWAASDELWLKRAALVCQVVRGPATDVELLAFAIEHSVDGRDFFLRKGIGWAMRSLAKRQPEVVEAWLERWKGRLSPLSVREANKGLAASKRRGGGAAKPRTVRRRGG